MLTTRITPPQYHPLPHPHTLPPLPPLPLSPAPATTLSTYPPTPLSSIQPLPPLPEFYHYTPILPRTAAVTAFNKRCETCSCAHDGSFGAGRFCSSRCARTVGGLAHRKKRMLERDAKQRMAVAQQQASKRQRYSPECDEAKQEIPTSRVMDIGALLNPCD